MTSIMNFWASSGCVACFPSPYMSRAATLFTRRDDIHVQEKRTQVFSSYQPDGLMVILMGENMMRKDGDAQLSERKALFPALSPRTVQSHWKPIFQAATAKLLDVKPGTACLVIERLTWRGEQPITRVRQVFLGDAWDLVARFAPGAR